MANGVTLENINGGTVTLQYSGTGNTNNVITIPEVTSTLVTQTDIADKITLAQANVYDIGVGQSWVDVTASRSNGTTYTNTTGKPIEVLINADTSSLTTVSVGGVQIMRKNVNALETYAFIVPKGSTYAITGGSSIILWAELR